jgi:hypothetical protein
MADCLLTWARKRIDGRRKLDLDDRPFRSAAAGQRPS